MSDRPSAIVPSPNEVGKSKSRSRLPREMEMVGLIGVESLLPTPPFSLTIKRGGSLLPAIRPTMFSLLLPKSRLD